MERIFNFSAGPAVMPESVLERAREEMLSLGGIGMSVMEISHRSSHFDEILEKAETGIRRLLNAPDDLRILFMQGGASLQFSMVPINFLPDRGHADYIETGYWGRKARLEAERCAGVNVIWSGAENGFREIPQQTDIDVSSDASYLHYVSNETIDGVEFNYSVDGQGVPVVCDMSSNILSKPVDLEKYSLIYAGAQKNIGPSGVTLVMIRDEMIDRVGANMHSSLNYRTVAENRSMANTPNTWGIYLVSLICEWLEQQGGLTAMEQRNIEKAGILYEAIDSSDGFYTAHAARSARSMMNVVFRLQTAELDTRFCEEAEAAGLSGLKGHRSVGGVRASIYNAFPKAGVTALVDLMKDFAAKNG